MLPVASCRNISGTSEFKPSSGTVVSRAISNENITCFAEDQYGYIWMGTYRGLNRYNSREFKQYFNDKNDSTSLSGNIILSLLTDSKGRLWVGTLNGICRYDFESDIFERIPIGANNHQVNQIFEAADGRIFANLLSCLCEYDQQNGRFKMVLEYEPGSSEHSCHADNMNRVWVSSTKNFKCYDLTTLKLLFNTDNNKKDARSYYAYLYESKEFWGTLDNHLYIIDVAIDESKPVPRQLKRIIPSHSTINIIYPYTDEFILISTKTDGIFLYNRITDELIHQSSPNFPFDAPDRPLNAIFMDSRENLWIAPLDHGFFANYKFNEQFHINNPLRKYTTDQTVGALAVDHSKNLLVYIPINHELIIYNLETFQLDIIDFKNIIKDNGLEDRISNIFIDSENYIWLVISDKLYKCKYHNNKVNIIESFSFPTIITCITEDYKKTIWVGGIFESLYAKKANDEEFLDVKKGMEYGNSMNSILRLSTGHLLTVTGQRKIEFIFPDTWKIKTVDLDSLKNVIMTSYLFEDSRRNVWIATINEGLLMFPLPEHISFDSIQIQDIKYINNGISCEDIRGIVEDYDGNIWIGTSYGLNKYNVETEQMTAYYSEDGIGGNQFRNRASCVLPDSTLAFGGTHGLSIFKPSEVKVNDKIQLYFESFNILKGAESFITRNNMILNPDIRLEHSQNSFSISYVALDYNEFPRLRFSYKLEGYDRDWVNATYDRTTNYSNVPPGKYTFRVRVTRHGTDDIEAENSISINIRQILWLRTYMIILYIIGGGALFFFLNSLIYRVKRTKERTRQVLKEKEHEAYINKMNMRFFTNMSHEFRTPLTMIAGPVRTLSQDANIKEDKRELLKIVYKSVQHMLRLVNYMMDFNKLEDDALRLKVKNDNLTERLREVTKLFEINAKARHIDFTCNGLDQSYIALFDREKIERIFENLLSNALKFTTDNGAIEVTFDVISGEEATKFHPNANVQFNYIKISVGDTGVGIPLGKKEEIFDRYYQVENSDSGLPFNVGTGIGLYYARRLALLHHGYISVENKEKQGCIFSLVIPASRESYSTSEIELPFIENKFAVEPIDENDVHDELINKNDESHAHFRPHTILVVEDDMDVAQYLNILLSSIYNVVNKSNADNAFEFLESAMPDLIISDVLMPGIDGYQFCRKLKDNVSFCHIPVIMLTAKVLLEEQIQGLQSGADAYVTKPFEPSYLLALIKSQLENRDRIRNTVIRKTSGEDIEAGLLSSRDKIFIDDLYKLMDDELSNAEINVEEMSKALLISRAKFYYKVKGLTGQPPNVFFRTYKLNRAAELLKEGNYNITEVSDMTGFKSLSHFSASFKKQFGQTPSEFIG